MNADTIRYETIDLEEVIKTYQPNNIESKLPNIESDEQAAMMVMHDYTGEPLHYLDPEMHGQIDPEIKN